MKPIELVSDYLEEIGFTKRGMAQRSDDRLGTCSFWMEYPEQIFLRFTRRYYKIRIEDGTMMVVSVFRDRYQTRDVDPLEDTPHSPRGYVIGPKDLITLTRDLHEADSLKWLENQLRYFDELIIGSEKLWYPDDDKQRSS